MTSLKRALWLLGAAGLFVGLIVAAIILTSDHTQNRGLFAALILLIAWSFIGTGLYAWSRRPSNRVGAIMTATGFSWFLLPLGAANAPAIFAIGGLFNSVPIVFTAYLLLAFPSGELRGRGDRAIVAIAVIAGIVFQIGSGLFFDTAHSSDCTGCPANPILVAHNDTVFNSFVAGQNLLGTAVLIALIVVLVRRYRAYTPAQRAAFSPVLWTGAAALASFVAVILANLAGAPDAVADLLFILAVCVFSSVPFAFLVGLMRGRFTRAGAVSDLVERIGSAPVGERELRDTLAESLGDPTLEVAYWLPEREIYVDGEGNRMVMPDEGSGRAYSSVQHDGNCIAAIIHEESLLEEPDLIRTVGAAAALALENERLDAALRARVEELRASRTRIVEAGNAARRKIERDLHDGAQQHLVALSLDLKLARSKVAEDPEQARELLDRAVEQLDEATSELRELARGIHPAVLTDRGLGEALKSLATRAPLPVELDCETNDRLPDAVESTAYFVVAEALTNVSRYAQASHAAISLARDNGRVVIEVRDDGVGGADPGSGSGLRGLQDRVAALDGTMEVVSPAGDGTVVRASLPCA